MQFRTLLAAGVAALSFCMAIVPASAGIISSVPSGSTFVPFPVTNVFGPGPETFGPGITWSSTNTSQDGGSVFGWTNGYGFGSNGVAYGDMTGLNDNTFFYGATDTMTFSFSTPVNAVGGVINWYPDRGDSVHIDFYDTSNNLLADLVLNNAHGNVHTPNAFYGFESSSANIGSFKLTDGFVGVIGGLSIGGVGGLPIGGVPEPATWALLILGVAMIGITLRRRNAGIALPA